MPEDGPLVRQDLLSRIREVENVFVRMPDGRRLAARMWLPADADENPVPAILELIPYRKRDFMRARDERMHRYFAGHGYAAVRVDVHGSGDSDGVLRDEYSAQELDDAVSVIEWIASQSWCTGKVGMMGISWGGFNTLQVAAKAPPALGAVITLCASDDRYADDAHYMGGCLLNENLQWGAVLMTYNALPPDPEIVGDRWREMWLERLDEAVAFPALWMQHPWRDELWKHGSVCEEYSAIRCPVYAVGGWADGYSSAVARLLAGLPGIRKGLVGPWAHTFPHNGYPGPSIGFLQEAIRWWDQFLRGKDTGILDEPIYRVWMQESVPPAPQYEERPGRWVAEAEWPSPRIHWRQWFLNAEGLTDVPEAPTDLSICSPQLTGVVSGEWCAFGSEGEMPLDQRPDDGRSLAFDGPPLEERLEILGAVGVELSLSSDSEVALVAVRLNDVAPDGTSTRVTYGLLNLTHRDSHERPEPLSPGAPYRIRLELNDVAHAFPPGHRVRLAISTSYWPIAWPAPTAATLTLKTGQSSIRLPTRPPDPADDDLPAFEPPEVAPAIEHHPLRALPLKRVVERDLTTNEMIYTLSSDAGEFGGHSRARLEELGLELGYTLTKRHWIAAEDPLSAKSELVQRASMSRGDWSVRVETTVRLTSERHHLRFRAELAAFENERNVRTRSWDEEIPRKLF